MSVERDVRRAIRLAVRKPAPSKIPLSGMDRLRTRDYYTVTFDRDGFDRSFLVDQIEGDTVYGRWVSSRTEPEAAEISVAEIAEMQIEIRQYLREIELRYDSALEFFWHSIFRIPQLRLFRERFSNYVFSMKLLVRADRIGMLRRFIDLTEEGLPQKTAMNLMDDIYGRRWSIHPQGMHTYYYTKLLLDSLVASGDLEQQDYQYKATARAILTLSESEVEDRRHNDNVSMQKIIVLLTILLTIIGAVQACAAIRSAAAL